MFISTLKISEKQRLQYIRYIYALNTVNLFTLTIAVEVVVCKYSRQIIMFRLHTA
jgi:hypothetical protein